MAKAGTDATRVCKISSPKVGLVVGTIESWLIFESYWDVLDVKTFLKVKGKKY